jgi:polyribonucleotide nucleotidyltransferase
MAAMIDTERQWLMRMRGGELVVRNLASWRTIRGYGRQWRGNSNRIGLASTSRLRERERGSSSDVASTGDSFADVSDRKEGQAEFLRTLSVGDRVWGRVRNIVAYGAFIDLGCVDGLLHLSEIPGAVNGMIGEKLTKGEEIEVEVLEINIERQRISLRIPTDFSDGE